MQRSRNGGKQRNYAFCLEGAVIVSDLSEQQMIAFSMKMSNPKIFGCGKRKSL